MVWSAFDVFTISESHNIKMNLSKALLSDFIEYEENMFLKALCGGNEIQEISTFSEMPPAPFCELNWLKVFNLFQ